MKNSVTTPLGACKNAKKWRRKTKFKGGKQSPCVFVQISLDHGVGTNLLRGIIAYMRRNPQWIVPVQGTRPLGATPDMLAKLADGVIAQIPNLETENMLLSADIPVVRVAGTDAKSSFPCVRVDDHEVGRQAARHFVELGIRRVLCVYSSNVSHNLARSEGFGREAQAGGTEVHIADFQGVSADLGGIDSRWFAAQLKKIKRPFGVFAMDDRLAFRVLQACHALKYAVPEEVAVIGCNDDEILCQIAIPSLSSLPVPAYEIGFNAAHLLDHFMGRRERPPDQLIFQPGPVHVRESTDRISTMSSDLAVALHFIREHSTECIYVQDVVSAAGIPRRTLELLFQRNVKCGIHEHIRDTHLVVAERLLRDDKLTQSEIASRSGFPNAACLDRAFRGKHGLSPKEYQQKIFRKQRVIG